MTGASSKNGVTTLLLCFFLGVLGIHRFYVGKVGSGIVQLLTAGIFGVWTLVDFVLIVTGKFTDGEGKVILLSQPAQTSGSDMRKAA